MKFSISIGGTLSEIYNQEEGVQQGSILSVTLFSLKINGIVGCLLQDIECFLYVDDFLIFYRAKHMSTIERKLNICLTKLKKWSNANAFRFSRKKLYALLPISQTPSRSFIVS